MARIEIRPYDGNLEALRKLGYRSWINEYQNNSWPDLYTKTISQYYIEGCEDKRLMVGAYLKDELVGFMANIPRNYRFQGQPLRGMISGLLAISPDYPGALGVMVAACMEGNKEFGADFTLFTLDKGHKLLRHAKAIKDDRRLGHWSTECLVVEKTLVHAIDFPLIREHEGIGTLESTGISLWGAHRPLRIPKTRGVIRACIPADLPQILALTQRVPDEEQLVRLYDLPALEKRFNPGELSQALGGMVVYELDGEIKGFISYSHYDMVNPRGSRPWTWIDLIYWEDCQPKEKQALIAGAWELSRKRGCIGVLAWARQTISYRPLLQARFLPYPEPMNVQVAYLNPRVSLRGAKGVFEQVI